VCSSDLAWSLPVGASIGGLIRPFPTPYRARNVGNIVGNENFREFFFRNFNSLRRKFYSNSGSQIFQRFSVSRVLAFWPFARSWCHYGAKFSPLSQPRKLLALWEYL
jgi:hypothetical protein